VPSTFVFQSGRYWPADRARAFDRRIAVALGVMLDTGERR
jgi:hypothetical protein